MALIVKDRIKETASAPGVGAVTLLGAASGFRSFADIGNGNSTYYCIADQTGNNWEVGTGTWSTGNTLSRDTVLSNSLGTTALINFSSGAQDVFVTYPSEKAILGDTSAVSSTGTGSVVLSANPTITNGATISATTEAINIGGTGTTSGAINIGRGTTAGAQTVQIGGTGTIVTIGAASGIQPITIGRSGTSLAVVNINTGSAGGKTTNIATNTTSGTNTVSIGSLTSSGTNVINLATGSGTQTINIASGLSTTDKTINIANGGSSNTFVDIGGGSDYCNISIGTGSGSNDITINGIVYQQTYLVANLPIASVGARSFVTNALAPAFGSTVVGGGAVSVPVYHDGTNWKVG